MSQLLTSPSNIWLTGASSGIGEALVHELAGAGHKLIVTGRRQEPLDELLQTFPNQIAAAAADTTSKNDLQGVKSQLDHFGDLDMVILNAGTCEYLEVAEYNSDVIANNVTTNVIGTARCLDIALPALRATRAKGKPATLVIVSSSAWWFPFGRAEGYGAWRAMPARRGRGPLPFACWAPCRSRWKGLRAFAGSMKPGLGNRRPGA